MRTTAAASSALLLFASMTAMFTTKAADPEPGTRDEAISAIRELRKILTPNGIDQQRLVEIGGIKQYISVRGRDRTNPAILVLHGGPGFPELPLAWWNTRDLEEYFTVVHWDQRGSGKTYLTNDPDRVAPTMNARYFISDTAEVVDWIRSELGQEKIFLLGHSWGSYIGLEYALRAPSRLHAYIGVGQATNTPESERRGYAYAMEQALRTGNQKAVSELRSIVPYAAPGEKIPLEDIMIQRRWSDWFGGVMAYRRSQTNGIANILTPDYSMKDAERIYEGNGYSQEFLFGEVIDMDMSHVTKIECPIVLLEGRHDRTVNSQVAFEWFQKLEAPSKQFVWFEHSGHEVMSEEPGKVLVSLLRFARPLAEVEEGRHADNQP